MKVWIYYRTDGDSGWYGVKIFRSNKAAEAWLLKDKSGYGRIEEFNVV